MSTSSRTLKILKHIASSSGPFSIAGISRSMKMERNAVRRSIRSLEEEGFVFQVPGTPHFELSESIASMADQFLQKSEKDKLIEEYLHVMSEATGETCTFASLQGINIVAMDFKRGRNEFAYDIVVGDKIPTHCSSVGRAITAYNFKSLAALVMQSAEPFTERTIIDPVDYLKELEKIKEQGYAIDDREWFLDLACGGSVITDPDGAVRSGIAICGPSSRFSPQYATEIAEYAGVKCTEISRRIHQYAA